MSSLGCTVINFLLFGFIYLSFSLVYFKNDAEYFISLTVLVFILLMRFLRQSLISRNFLVLLGYSFCPFFISDGVCYPIFTGTSNFLFLQEFWFFPDLAVLFLQLFLFSLFSLSASHIFPSQILFPCPNCIFLLFVCSSFPYLHMFKVVYIFLWFCKFIASCRFPKYIIEWHYCFIK